MKSSIVSALIGAVAGIIGGIVGVWWAKRKQKEGRVRSNKDPQRNGDEAN